jgi:hypothetical protein
VIGYNESNPCSDTVSGQGCTTIFAVGDCTDVVISVVTTAPNNGQVTFTVQGTGAIGSIGIFRATGSIGTEEFDSCMFDNDYTITKVIDGWQGTVSVVSRVKDNTIHIPVQENWIIQGAIDLSSGAPVTLDARFSSGTYADISFANIVFRHFRITGNCHAWAVRPPFFSGTPSSVPSGKIHIKHMQSGLQENDLMANRRASTTTGYRLWIARVEHENTRW